MLVGEAPNKDLASSRIGGGSLAASARGALELLELMPRLRLLGESWDLVSKVIRTLNKAIISNYKHSYLVY